MGTSGYIDIHSHSTVKGDYFKLVSLFLGESPELANGNRFSAGIHPYHVSKVTGSIDGLFDMYGNALTAVGETGIDRTIDISLVKQADVFEQHLIAARRLNLPVVIHAVRSYSDIIGIIKRYRDLCYIFHAFNGKGDIVNKLMDYNAYFSVGIRELNRPGARESIEKIPLNRFFLETDDSNVAIEDVYFRAANVLGTDVEMLAEMLYANYKRIIK